MKLVIIESTFAGDRLRNIAYARAAMKDWLDRGEAPLASHLLTRKRAFWMTMSRTKGFSA